jgi:hypothetical protein
MQVSIFVSHVAGTGLFWLIHASWGLSDSSEQFVFLSGLALGSVFALKEARGGFAAALRDLAQRLRRLYVMHLGVAVLFAALVLWADATLLPGEIVRLGWHHLLDAPLAAAGGVAVTLYQPDFIGILPVFLWCMLLMPGFLWLAGRVGGWALLPPAALYAAVQAFGLGVPGLGGVPLAFNPFAWQFLFLLGAWFGRRKLLTGQALAPSTAITVAASAVVATGLYARLVGHEVLPDLGLGAELLDGKGELPPWRLLHALALAWLAARLIPSEAGWMRGRLAQALADIGRNSLPVFCLGLFLSWGIGVALRLHPADAMWLDPLLVLGGAGALALFARFLARGAPAGRVATGHAR